MKFWSILFMGTFLSFFYLFSSLADTLLTTSRESLKGTIIQDNQDGVTLQTKYGQIKLPVTQIAEVIYDVQVPGDKYVKEKQYDKAIVEYQKAIEKLPQNTEFVARISYKIGLCQFKLENHPQAIETFQKMLVDYSETTTVDKALFQLAQSYQKQGEDTLAISKYQQLVQEFPESTLADDALYQTGLIYEETKDLDKALNVYEEVVNKFPKSNILEFTKERIDQIQFDEQAPELLAQIKARFEEISQMKWNYKNLVLYNDVLKQVQRIVIQTENPLLALKVQKIIVDCYMKQAEYKKAEIEKDKYIKLFSKITHIPQNDFFEIETFLIEYIDQLIDMNNYGEARRICLECLEIKRSIQIQYRLGLCLMMQRSYRQAIQVFTELINDFSPGKEFIENCYRNIGQCYLYLGEYENAISVQKSLN